MPDTNHGAEHGQERNNDEYPVFPERVEKGCPGEQGKEEQEKEGEEEGFFGAHGSE